MAQVKDSSLSMEIIENIMNSRTNDGIVSKESAKYVFGNITFDDPLMIPRQFWEIFDRAKIREEIPPNMKYKPEMFARKYYNSADLWWFVLMSNNMTSHRDFKNDWAYRCDSQTVNRLEELLEATTVAINKKIELEDLTLYPVKI